MKEMIFGLLVTGVIKVQRQEVQVEPNTYVSLTVKLTGKKGNFDVTGHGFARHNQADQESPDWAWDPKMGVALASVRAADHLAGQLAKLKFDFVQRWREIGIG